MGGRAAQRLLSSILEHFICLTGVILSAARVGKQLWLVHQVVLDCGRREGDDRLNLKHGAEDSLVLEVLMMNTTYLDCWHPSMERHSRPA